MCNVFYEEETEFVNIIQMSFSFKDLIFFSSNITVLWWLIEEQ
jgi:hypothetical protein